MQLLCVGQGLGTASPTWKVYDMPSLHHDDDVVIDGIAQVCRTTFFLIGRQVVQVIRQMPGTMYGHLHQIFKPDTTLDVGAVGLEIHSAADRLLVITDNGGVVFDAMDNFMQGMKLLLPDKVEVFRLGKDWVFGFASEELKADAEAVLHIQRAKDGNKVDVAGTIKSKALYGKHVIHKLRDSVTFANGSDLCLLMAGACTYSANTAYMLKAYKKIVELAKIGKFNTNTMLSVAANATHLYVFTTNSLACFKSANLCLKDGYKTW